MGSIQEDLTARSRDEVTVLVTGFGPFQDKYPVNPSFEIAQSLPDILPSTSSCPKVRIIAYDTPIRVAYDEVRELVPKMQSAYKGVVDLCIHIGMASGRKFYCIERYGHRDGYSRNKDLDGKMPSLDEGKMKFGDCPTTMTTALDFESILLKWQVNVLNIPSGEPGAEADVRPSQDAGHYLCDYIYFNSLAFFGRQNGAMEGGKGSDRPVLFFHVPADSDEKSIEKGGAVAVALIRAMASSFHRRQQ